MKHCTENVMEKLPFDSNWGLQENNNTQSQYYNSGNIVILDKNL